MITDQQWKDLDLLPTNPGKPRYDPFEIFKPTKTFLREVIKDLQHAAYCEIKNYREINGVDAEIYGPIIEARIQDINQRIKSYQWKIRASATAGQASIGNDEISRAKELPITLFYQGILRKTGKDLVGLCPFHQDSHPSFTIYDDGKHYKCFSCSKQGDTIDFVQRTENLTFIQAIKKILKI